MFDALIEEIKRLDKSHIFEEGDGRIAVYGKALSRRARKEILRAMELGCASLSKYSSGRQTYYAVSLECLEQYKRQREKKFDISEVCNSLPPLHNKDLLCIYLTSRVRNVMLIGPPGSGKSHLLFSLADAAAPYSQVVFGYAFTAKGLYELLATGKIRVLCIDELDKADPREVSVLLGIAERNYLSHITAEAAEKIDIGNLYIVATANDFALKKSPIWEQIRDRFMLIKFDKLDEEKIAEIITNAENLDANDVKKLVELVKDYIDHLSLRAVINLAKVYKTHGIDAAKKALQAHIKAIKSATQKQKTPTNHQDK